MPSQRLFTPIKVGHASISHRIAMAPLTRFRADANHVPSPHAKEYYEQRASEPGTLLITEGTFISPRAGGYKHVPGIWSDEQIAAWKDIVDVVHRKGAIIYVQLWALGRVAQPEVLQAAEGGPYQVSSASAIPVPGSQSASGKDMQVPVELSEDGIQTYIQEYAQAATNAMKAGFDGVELHGANGYLIDQFWQDVSNQRTDQWGGSIENRARFGLEVTKAVIKAIGDSQKVAMRLSPYVAFQAMGMQDPIPQFTEVIDQLKKLDIAYLHLIESRASGSAADGVYHDKGTDELKPLLQAWGTKEPLVLAGGYTSEKADRVITELGAYNNLLFGFGRYFISTPDLAYRIRHGLELNAWDRSTFYSQGPEGYIDYPFSSQYLSDQQQDSRL